MGRVLCYAMQAGGRYRYVGIVKSLANDRVLAITGAFAGPEARRQARQAAEGWAKSQGLTIPDVATPPIVPQT